MKVLVWCSWIAECGGMERVAISLANGLAQNGWDVLLVGPYSNAPKLCSVIGPRVEYVDYRPVRSVTGLIKTRAFLRRLMQRNSVNVVSAHGSVFPFLGAVVPVVWTEHSLRYGMRPMFSGPRGLAWRLVAHELKEGRWRLVGVSKFIATQVTNQLRLEGGGAAVIHNGIPDEPAFRTLAPPAMEQPYRIGYLGRLEPEKRPLDVFSLAPLLETMGVPCEWHIFGKGSLWDDMCAACQTSPATIIMRGYVESIREVFKSIDLLFLPSREEGLPTAVLEARLAGRWVAAWNTTGIPEAAGPDNILVNPAGALPGMADAIAGVLRSGRRPPAVPAGLFSYSQMIVEYDELLHKTAAGKRTARKRTKEAAA
jgi:glycosyltransferase involved in cell wall biosynthesis